MLHLKAPPTLVENSVQAKCATSLIRTLCRDASKSSNYDYKQIVSVVIVHLLTNVVDAKVGYEHMGALQMCYPTHELCHDKLAEYIERAVSDRYLKQELALGVKLAITRTVRRSKDIENLAICTTLNLIRELLSKETQHEETHTSSGS